MIVFYLEPWEVWPRQKTKPEARPFNSPFKSSYPKTCDLLNYELERLKVVEAVIQLKGVVRGGTYRSGLPMENVRTEVEPGVIVSFTRAGRPLALPCDRFRTWQDNMRAIAVALEHLRGADRYGVTQSGEQYRGWEALPPPGASSRAMTKEDALDIIAKWSAIPQVNIAATPRLRSIAIKEARINVHPDKGGKPEDAAQVSEAARILEEPT